MKICLHLVFALLIGQLCHAQGPEAPTITSISVTSSVDVTASEQIVTAIVQINAVNDGFDFGNLFLYRADGNFVSSHAMGSSQRTAGDEFDGTYEVQMTVPRYAPAGTWEVRSFVENAFGDVRNYGGDDEAFPVPTDALFTVVNSGTTDSTAPSLVSVSVTPSPIDTGTIAQDIQITMNITDTLSGFRSASLTFRDPTSDAKFGISGFVFFSRVISGDAQDGVYVINSRIPQGSLDGTWTFDVFLSDQVGNRVSLSAPPAASFEVSNIASGGIGDLSDAGDATQYSWATSGNQDWFPQATVTNDGVDAAQSGAIADDEVSDLEISLTGPGTLDFHWKVDSEEFADYLSVEILSGGDYQEISGDLDWTSSSVSIPAGPQTVRFRYEKDGSVSEGEDAGWVDQLCFTADTDSEDPVIQRLSLAPNPVSVAAGMVTVTVTIEVSDDANGFSDGTITLTELNSDNDYSSLSFGSADRISGDSKFGTYQITFDFYPEDFDPGQGSYQDGTYRISAELYEQSTGNVRFYGNDDDEFPIPSTEFFTVGGAPSGAAPFLTGITSITPAIVDVSSGDQAVTFEFDVVSNNFGFGFGSISVFNSDGYFAQSVSFDDSNRISGSDINGTYSVTIPVYEHSAPGTWSTSFYLSDFDNNEREYPFDTSFPNPGAENFTVANDGDIDTIDPVLTAFTLSQNVIDTSAGPQSIAVNFTITDDLSGIQSVSLYAYDPNDNFVNDSFTSFPTSGLLSDTYSGSFDLPMGSLEGTWNIVLSVRDRVGNSFFFVGDSLDFGNPFPAPFEGQFTVGPVVANTFNTFTSTFGLTGMAALSGGNPDGDLFDNAMEFLLGLDPTVSNPPNPLLYEVVRVGDEIRINFTIDPSLTITTSGNFLELSSGGNAPVMITGQTGANLQNDWVDQLPTNHGGSRYRITLPITESKIGMMQLKFVIP